jgi:hypothetical protein
MPDKRANFQFILFLLRYKERISKNQKKKENNA